VRWWFVVVLAACGGDPVGGPDAAAVDAAADTAPLDAGPDDAPADATRPTKSCRGVAAVKGVWLADPKLCLELYADNVPAARQMAFAPNGDLFVVFNNGAIVVLFDHNQDGAIEPGERSVFATQAGLTHGLALDAKGGWVYASNATTIFRWRYRTGDLVAASAPEVVVKDMPPGGHYSRTLVFDPQGRLYVNVGSAGNVDTTPSDLATRAMVRRLVVPDPIPAGGVAYATLEVFASGMRNEVGLAFDAQGRMWGVENERDGLADLQLAGITEDNPAEELNRLDGPGARFFGYPLCWSEFAFPDGGLGPGTQWADDYFPMPKTDVWCRDVQNVHPPAGVMQGHWAPLGVTGYEGASLPWKGDLFVASHGSSQRTIPIGRLIARAHLVGDTIASITPIVGKDDGSGQLAQGTWDARPVDLRQGPDGALYFSDDLGGRVFRLGYTP